MSKITTKIAFPIILVGVFTIIIFMVLNYEQVGFSFYFITLLLIIFIFFFGLSIGQNFSSPIKKLLETANQLSKGNLLSRVDLETKDELAELARVFNKIAEELEDGRLREENAEKAINIKVKAKTQEFEETINALEQKVQNRTIEMQKLTAELDRLKNNFKNGQNK